MKGTSEGSQPSPRRISFALELPWNHRFRRVSHQEDVDATCADDLTDSMPQKRLDSKRRNVRVQLEGSEVVVENRDSDRRMEVSSSQNDESGEAVDRRREDRCRVLKKM